jgi:hypothetical protein
MFRHRWCHLQEVLEQRNISSKRQSAPTFWCRFRIPKFPPSSLNISTLTKYVCSQMTTQLLPDVCRHFTLPALIKTVAKYNFQSSYLFWRYNPIIQVTTSVSSVTFSCTHTKTPHSTTQLQHFLAALHPWLHCRSSVLCTSRVFRHLVSNRKQQFILSTNGDLKITVAVLSVVCR